jgi:hypothetical protein
VLQKCYKSIARVLQEFTKVSHECHKNAVSELLEDGRIYDDYNNITMLRTHTRNVHRCYDECVFRPLLALIVHDDP